jgi:neutral ceramidase
MNRQTVRLLPIKSVILISIMLLWLTGPAGLSLLKAAEAPAATAAPDQEKWKAGIATTVITPAQSMWMSGYAARTKPSEGKVHDLNAKALALQACPERSRGDSQGAGLVIVTVDLLGIPRPLREWMEKQVKQTYKLPPENLLLNASHTHCGPVVKEMEDSIYGDSFYGLSPEQIKRSRQYMKNLQQKLLTLVGQALDNLAPAKLAYTHARAGFAMNRRLKTERGYVISANPDGPVDHDVPVLRIDNPQGELQAVVFGYACHNTTLSFYKFCGDYAGFAQLYLEQAHPGTTAFFIAGCGGDQNPYPRRTLDLAKQHGRALANGVESALLWRGSPVHGPIRSALDTVTLDFAKPPGRKELEQQAKSDNKYERRHAEVLLKELEQNGKIRTDYPYLVQVIQFGDDLTMIALSGEVVVDYSLRLKAELAGPKVWVAAYSNDVFGYLPSLRVLQEGGYEGGGAMRYTNLPGPFAPSVEKRVIDKVHELVNKVRTAKNK